MGLIIADYALFPLWDLASHWGGHALDWQTQTVRSADGSPETAL